MIKIPKKEIKIVEKELFSKGFVKTLRTHWLEPELLGELMDLTGCSAHLLLPITYEDDDLTKPEYRKDFPPEAWEHNDWKSKEACENNELDRNDTLSQSNPNALGLYIVQKCKIILDLDAIAKCAEDINVDFNELKKIVLFHEIGHHVSRFGLPDPYIDNFYYQELIAQLVAFRCLSISERKSMKKLSDIQCQEYKNYLSSKLTSFRESSLEFFRLILSVEENDFIKIKSSDELITKVKNIQLSSDEEILNTNGINDSLSNKKL